MNIYIVEQFSYREMIGAFSTLKLAKEMCNGHLGDNGISFRKETDDEWIGTADGGIRDEYRIYRFVLNR